MDDGFAAGTDPARSYGLTTEEAVQAFLDGHLDQLSPHNRWKFALLNHQEGGHDAAADAYARVCPACQRALRIRAA